MTSYDQNRANFILPSDNRHYNEESSPEPSYNNSMNKPLFSGESSSSPPPTNYGSSAPASNAPNWPICKPVIHHDIGSDIEQDQRMFIRQAYVGWYFHSFAIFWNFICMSGNLFLGGSLIGFIMALLYLFLSPCCAFGPYWTVYNAAKEHSSFRYTLWFCLHGTLTLFEIVLALGVEETGGAGLILAVTRLADKEHTLGVMIFLSFFAWSILVLFNVWIFYKGRAAYSDLGGSKAAAKEFGTGVVKTAYENKETIGQVAYENKDAIKQVIVDNKDEIYQFAVDNKDTIGQIASENKETIVQLAYDNRDTLAENRGMVDDVFGGGNKEKNPFE